MTTSYLYTASEACSYLNISRSSLYVLMREKRIHSVRIGRSRRIPLDELNRFIESLEVL
jgi:excisionase family DNA binding protein